MRKKKRKKLRRPIEPPRRREPIKPSRHKIFRHNEIPLIWIPCQRVRRATKRGKFEYYERRVPLAVCVIKSDRFDPMDEECYGCGRWQRYVVEKGDGKYAKKRRRIPDGTGTAETGETKKVRKPL